LELREVNYCENADHFWTRGSCLCIKCGLPYCIYKTDFECPVKEEGCTKLIYFKIFNKEGLE